MFKFDSKFNSITTLIYLLLPLAMLVLMAIPQFMSARDKAKISATVQSLKEIKFALQMYFNENNTYPLELNKLKDINANSKKLIDSLNNYTDATNLLKYFKSEEIKSIQITKNNFTITAKATDRNYTLITVNAESIFYPH